MSQYIHLVGAESVERAGYNMKQAADQMRSCVSEIEAALFRHQQWAEDWLARYQAITDKKP